MTKLPLEECSLQRFRILMAILMTLSLVAAPISVAMAQHQVQPAVPTMSGAMSDCAKMMGQAGGKSDKSNHCACCDIDSACPPALCLTKCFKVFSPVLPLNAMATIAVIAWWAAEPVPPPDWSSRPLPPPPRV
jgi:hypothetical protein